MTTVTPREIPTMPLRGKEGGGVADGDEPEEFFGAIGEENGAELEAVVMEDVINTESSVVAVTLFVNETRHSRGLYGKVPVIEIVFPAVVRT